MRKHTTLGLFPRHCAPCDQLTGVAKSKHAETTERLAEVGSLIDRLHQCDDLRGVSKQLLLMDFLTLGQLS